MCVSVAWQLTEDVRHRPGIVVAGVRGCRTHPGPRRGPATVLKAVVPRLRPRTRPTTRLTSSGWRSVEVSHLFATWSVSSRAATDEHLGLAPDATSTTVLGLGEQNHQADHRVLAMFREALRQPKGVIIVGCRNP